MYRSFGCRPVLRRARLQQVESKIWGMTAFDLFASNSSEDSGRKEIIVDEN